MDFMSLRLQSSSLTCSISALGLIILQLVAMECRKLHMVDSPIGGKHFVNLLTFTWEVALTKHVQNLAFSDYFKDMQHLTVCLPGYCQLFSFFEEACLSSKILSYH